MKHVMFDLETMGTKPGCVIASIGAVAFDDAVNQAEAVIEAYKRLRTK